MTMTRNLRWPAVVEVYLASVILIAVLGCAFAPGPARNTVKLGDEAPVLLDGLLAIQPSEDGNHLTRRTLLSCLVA